MKNNNTSLEYPVKLHVQHHDDIHVISAHLQDAIITSSSFYHDHENTSFKLLCNRFCWEKFLISDNAIKLRVNAGLHFDHVTHVKKKNIHLHHPEKLYNLLAIQASEKEIILIFSGYSEIKLTVEQISCKLADLHAPYVTNFLPDHTDHLTTKA